MSALKARLRAQFRDLRAQQDAAHRQRASHAIGRGLAALVADRRPSCISAFWPKAHEVDLRPFLRQWATSGVTVCLPVVVPGDSPALVHRAFQRDSELVQGAFGVMHPPEHAPVVPPARIELAIVPALSASRNGTRLGYGGGYYDAFLAQTDALRAGVLLSASLTDALPSEPHDQRLAVIVTETETVWIRNSYGGTA